MWLSVRVLLGFRTQKSKTRTNSVDPNEVAHYEPPHLGLQCLRIQLHVFSVFGTLCVSLTLFWWPTLTFVMV